MTSNRKDQPGPCVLNSHPHIHYFQFMTIEEVVTTLLVMRPVPSSANEKENMCRGGVYPRPLPLSSPIKFRKFKG